MSTERPKLGGVFRGEVGPDRAAGLAGLLSGSPAVVPADRQDSEPTSDDGAQVRELGPFVPVTHASRATVGERAPSLAPVAVAESATTAEPPGERRKVKATSKTISAATADRTAKNDPADAMKMVPVNIDASLHPELKRFAMQTELSFGTIALRAVEASVDELSTMWSKPPTAVKSGLFGSTQRRSGNRRAEPAVQVQLRMPAADAQVLDELVTNWMAPSRSSLINEALRLYVAPSGSESTR